MDSLFLSKPPEFMTSAGGSLNVAVNELADVLRTFFLNVVEDGEGRLIARLDQVSHRRAQWP